MKNLRTIIGILLVFNLILSSCKSDDDSAPQPPPNFASEFVGLWEFDNDVNYADAIYFGENGEAFQVFYGDLNTVQLILGDYNTYEYNNNTISYFRFGNDPISYDGGSSINIPGNSLSKVNNITSLDNLIETIDTDNALSIDVTTFFNNDSYNNFDGFGDQLLIPNPTAGEGRYIRFQKSNLSYIETVTGIGQSATSISVYDTNPFELLSVLESNNKFRIYQPTNPANHPAVSDIPFTPNSYRCHTITNESGRDFISYSHSTGTFNYHDVDATYSQQGVSEFAFFDNNSHLIVRGLDYVKGENKLLISDSYNIHVFNIGFNSDGDGVSVFEHERSISIVPLRLSNEELFGRIQGLYYDTNETLYMLVNNGGEMKLVKTLLEL